MGLLAEIARGGVNSAFVREGGFASALWAGPADISKAMVRGDVSVQGSVRNGPVALQLGIASSDEDGFGYAIDLGLPPPVPPSAFSHDPQVKSEYIWYGPHRRPSCTLVERRNAQLRLQQGKKWVTVERPIPEWASMLSEFADPQQAPEMLSLREQLRSWRFYDHFRCDAQAPARHAQLVTRTPVMSADGHDVASALQTILEIGDEQALQDAVDDAFPGSLVRIDIQGTRNELCLQQPGMLRPLRAAELSDGTLRFLLWTAALLTPRPPSLMILNEPETSLHPDLLPALGRLIIKAAKCSQIMVITHAPRLIAAIESASENIALQSLVLKKELGQTQLANIMDCDVPFWEWPKR
jgi:predicted ATPase